MCKLFPIRISNSTISIQAGGPVIPVADNLFCKIGFYAFNFVLSKDEGCLNITG